MWEEWRAAEDWDRPTKLDHYLARAYAAEHLAKKGETKVDVARGLMPFTRELKAPLTGRAKAEARRATELAETATLLDVLATAGGGMKGVKHRLLHKDGSLTDAKTGEVLRGPTPEYARE